MDDTANGREEVVSTGVSFLRALAEAYGSETAITMWDNMARDIDPVVRGEVFMAMLTGNTGNIITVVAGTDSGICDKIELIKFMRTVDRRRLTLKEAKDMSDVLLVPGGRARIEVDTANHKPHTVAHKFRTWGFRVN